MRDAGSLQAKVVDAGRATGCDQQGTAGDGRNPPRAFNDNAYAGVDLQDTLADANGYSLPGQLLAHDRYAFDVLEAKRPGLIDHRDLGSQPTVGLCQL